MKFLLSSTPIFRQWTRCLPLQHARFISEAAELYAHTNTSPTPVVTFEDAGLRAPLAKAVGSAFPNVKFPTEIQSTLIANVTKGKDIILQNETGSGKSFGLILALLNKPRLMFEDVGKHRQCRERKAITSLVLVPHRDLAFQMLHWVDRIIKASPGTPPRVSSIAQVLVREGGRHLTEGLSLLRDDPPHILIATPNSVAEVLEKDPEAFCLGELSTVVVDEADYMIETVPLNKGNSKQNRNIAKHPGPARKLLDAIYENRPKFSADNREVLVDAPYHLPQLIVSSATIRRQLKHYFFSETRYLNREVVKIRGTVMRLHAQDELSSDALAFHSKISHHVLVASDGGIVNITGAREPEERDSPRFSIEEANNGASDELPRTIVDDAVAAKRLLGFSMTPSTLNQNSLEAVAAVFSLSVPSVALLVIPSNASVHRACYDLRELGVHAHGMDLLVGDRGRSHLQADTEQIKTNDPRLLVCTTSSIRGVDLPSLSHVFILGFETLTAKNSTGLLDNYIHISGRVGRFKKPGQVVTVVDAKTAGSMAKVLETLDIVPVRLNMFQ